VVLQQAVAARLVLRAPILFRLCRKFSTRQATEPPFQKRIGLVVAAARPPKPNSEVLIMLGWVITFLVIALIAGLLGFGGIAGASIEIAKIIFFIAIVLFLVSAVAHIARGRRI
jgi:uncharacterized membrane protein YtjA (UPF0391 family)